MRNTLIFTVIAALSTTACGSLSTHRVMTGNAQAPVAPSSVRVLLADAPVPASFAEVAIVESIGRGTYADLEHVIAGLQQEAARLGCTYVVHVRVDQGSGTATGTGTCGIAP
jgi:hypothetical protein